MKHTILHIVAGGGHGGAETFCLDAIKALHDRGVRQHVIARPHAALVAALTERQIPFTPFAFGWLDRLWGGAERIKKIINQTKPTLVHAWMGRAASFVPAQNIAPVLGWFGGYYDLKRYHNCHYYMGVTRDIVRYLEKSTSTPDRCFLGHTFGTLEPATPINRADLNTPEGAPVVLLLSRMHPKKGVDTLLRAAVEVPGAYFWLAGDGPNINEYKKLCTDLNLDERVRFLGWRNDRSALLAQASVCTLPSRYEPFGTVIPEAWFAGVPLVATKAAGARQYVTHELDGFLTEIDDVPGLAAALRRAIDDQALRARMVTHGQAIYERLFSRDAVMTALLKSYDQMTEHAMAAAA